MNPLYVVTVIFNPRRFMSRYRLYNNFKKWVLDAGVKLLTVEIAFGERPFVVTSCENEFDLQLRTSEDLWHKERGLNLGIQHLCKIAPEWKYVAWIDADIKIIRDDWATETVHLLQHYNLIQMFGEARSLLPDHHCQFQCPSILRNYVQYGALEWGPDPGIKNCNPYARKGHPGLAWAFRRDTLEGVGLLLDTCINGSGDLHMAGCYTGNSMLAMPMRVSPGYRRAVNSYGNRCKQIIRNNVGFMPGCIDHYWHGKSSQRGYDDRWKLVVKYQFDPYEDLIIDCQGLYKWAGNKKELQYEIRNSLMKRNEDSIDP